MGFFSDLKEDLNQAVSELMPGGAANAEETQAAPADGMAGLEAAQDDEETMKQLAELEEILQNMDMPAQDGETSGEFGGVGAAQGDALLDYEPLGRSAARTAEVPADIPAAGLDVGTQAQETEFGDAKVILQEAEEGQMELDMGMLLQGFGEPSQTELPKEEAVMPEPVPELAPEPMPEPVLNTMQELVPEETTTAVAADFGTEPAPEPVVEQAVTAPAAVEDDMQETVDQFQNAVAALKDSVDMQKAQEEEEKAEEPEVDLEEELRATFGAQEGEETVEDYMHAEAIRTGAEIIDKSWVLDLKGMETMDETAIITAGMRVKGDILSNGSADIIGEVIGNVQVKGKLNITGRINGNAKAEEIFADSAKINGDIISDSTVKVGVNSVIIGNIEATSAVIAGAVKGTIDVKGPVILDTTAVVLGNVRAKTMQINNGARIEGMCVLCYAEQSAAKFFEEQASL